MYSQQYTTLWDLNHRRLRVHHTYKSSMWQRCKNTQPAWSKKTQNVQYSCNGTCFVRPLHICLRGENALKWQVVLQWCGTPLVNTHYYRGINTYTLLERGTKWQVAALFRGSIRQVNTPERIYRIFPTQPPLGLTTKARLPWALKLEPSQGEQKWQ